MRGREGGGGRKDRRAHGGTGGEEMRRQELEERQGGGGWGAGARSVYSRRKPNAERRATIFTRPVRPTAAAPGLGHRTKRRGQGWLGGHFPYNEFTISRCAAGAHRACARGTMPRAPLGRTGLIFTKGGFGRERRWVRDAVMMGWYSGRGIICVRAAVPLLSAPLLSTHYHARPLVLSHCRARPSYLELGLQNVLVRRVSQCSERSTMYSESSWNAGVLCKARRVSSVNLASTCRPSRCRAARFRRPQSLCRVCLMSGSPQWYSFPNSSPASSPSFVYEKRETGQPPCR